MADPAAAFAERCEQILGVFAEDLAALARDIQQHALAADTISEKTEAASSLHKLGRCLRQTLVLHQKFLRSRLADEAEARDASDQAADAPRRWKVSRIRHAISRLVWDEHERDEDFEDGPGERLVEDIDARLHAISLEPAFMDLSDEALIARLCEEFSFEVPPYIVKALAIVARADAPRLASDGHDSS